MNALTLHALVSMVALLGLIVLQFTGHSSAEAISALSSIAGGAAWGAVQRQKEPVCSINNVVKDDENEV
jgi:hypothetical protein